MKKILASQIKEMKKKESTKIQSAKLFIAEIRNLRLKEKPIDPFLFERLLKADQR